MPKITPAILEVERGYTIEDVKKPSKDDAEKGIGPRFTLTKDGRTVVVDQAILDDVAAMATPIENTDDASPIKAVS